MKITFSPMRRDEHLTLERAGDTLTVNGEVFDFSPLEEGATLPAEAIDSDWFTSPVERDAAGVLTVPLILPHGKDAPEATRLPDPITVSKYGPIALPPFDVVTDDEGNAQEVHGEPVSVTSDGIIDWSLMTTPENRAEAALIEWREAASTDKSDFCVALVKANVLTPTQAVTASQGGWPEPMQAFLDDLTPEQAAFVQIKWAANTTIHRSDEFIDLLAWWLEFTPEQVDQLFGREAQ